MVKPSCLMVKAARSADSPLAGGSHACRSQEPLQQSGSTGCIREAGVTLSACTRTPQVTAMARADPLAGVATVGFTHFLLATCPVRPDRPKRRSLVFPHALGYLPRRSGSQRFGLNGRLAMKFQCDCCVVSALTASIAAPSREYSPMSLPSAVTARYCQDAASGKT